jgi:C1A family cysteine protease
MKILLLFLFTLSYCFEDSDLVVTQEYVDYLKRHVDWEVQDYENNVFRGWTIGEVKTILGLKDMNTYVEGLPDVEEAKALPSSINWAGSNCAHEVKNQGTCGACWAFAFANMLSDRCCLYSSDHGWLSVQELVSCSKEDYGCYGGGLSGSINYIKRAGGLVPDSCYPYMGANAECPNKCINGGDWRSSHVCKCVKAENCYRTHGIKSCLLSGPVPLGFQVCQSFISYKSGIYTCDCRKYIGGHATLALGYSDDPQCNYYVKNSWGTEWGSNGFYNMACETCELTGGQICSDVR